MVKSCLIGMKFVFLVFEKIYQDMKHINSVPAGPQLFTGGSRSPSELVKIASVFCPALMVQKNELFWGPQIFVCDFFHDFLGHDLGTRLRPIFETPLSCSRAASASGYLYVVS